MDGVEDVGRRVIHGSFAVPLDVSVPPDRAFAAYAIASVRRRWFRIPSDPASRRQVPRCRAGTSAYRCPDCARTRTTPTCWSSGSLVAPGSTGRSCRWYRHRTRPA